MVELELNPGKFLDLARAGKLPFPTAPSASLLAEQLRDLPRLRRLAGLPAWAEPLPSGPGICNPLGNIEDSSAGLESERGDTPNGTR